MNAFEADHFGSAIGDVIAVKNIMWHAPAGVFQGGDGMNALYTICPACAGFVNC